MSSYTMPVGFEEVPGRHCSGTNGSVKQVVSLFWFMELKEVFPWELKYPSQASTVLT